MGCSLFLFPLSTKSYASNPVLVTLFALNALSDLSWRYFRAIPACNFRRQRRFAYVQVPVVFCVMTWEFVENLALLYPRGQVWYIFDEHAYFISPTFLYSKSRSAFSGYANASRLSISLFTLIESIGRHSFSFFLSLSLSYFHHLCNIPATRQELRIIDFSS